MGDSCKISFSNDFFIKEPLDLDFCLCFSCFCYFFGLWSSLVSIFLNFLEFILGDALLISDLNVFAPLSRQSDNPAYAGFSLHSTRSVLGGVHGSDDDTDVMITMMTCPNLEVVCLWTSMCVNSEHRILTSMKEIVCEVRFLKIN